MVSRMAGKGKAGCMRILFVADGRSPIALNWIQYFVERGHEVHLASTFPCSPELRLASLSFIPTAFSQLKTGQARQRSSDGQVSQAKGISTALRGLVPVKTRTAFRQWLGPFTLPGAARQLNGLLETIRPEVVHAMRVPYEGMLASLAVPQAPLIISVWGNDFTLHAKANPWMAHYTRHALQRASALHTDCYRDQRLAREWGFSPDRPSIVLPGGGGVQADLFFPPSQPEPYPVIVNPRGLRAYVRSDTFFRSIPLVIREIPTARFFCPSMEGEPEARRWLEQLSISQAVDLLPRLSRIAMGDIFRKAWVAVSPSTHDGTPNTLLEAMACGCFPVVGDIESLREWITQGENGSLVDPGDPQALANAIIQALRDPGLRTRAAQINTALIARRAEYFQVMREAEDFYRRLVGY